VDKDGDCLKNKSTVQNIFQAHSPENLIFVVRHDLKDFVKNQGFTCISLDLQEGYFVWSDMLSTFWDLGISSLMVEGGAQLISSVLQSSAWQRLFLFQAPVILGGRSGITWSREFQIPNMQDQVRLLEPQYKQIEKDILITGKYGR
jgi:diaminohydroxyphosphoribosylaminopyrimidine deaminase/5-amino-6-(5-phosphoribosylamino)uracil reductase